MKTRRPAVVPLRAPVVLALASTSLVGVAAFGYPFVVPAASNSQHAGDAPWVFVILMALLALVVLAELSRGGLDAKQVAVLGVLAAAGGGMRVLGAGASGLDPIFFLLILAARVLGPGAGVVLASLAMLVGGFLTAGIGPWAPYQMITASWIALGAALLPRVRARAERWMLAGYGFVAGIFFGVVMNLWFWPFLASGNGMSYVPGEPVTANLRHYVVFYLATSLGWDLTRGILTAVLVFVGARPVLGALRRAVVRAAFDAPVSITPAATDSAAATPASVEPIRRGPPP